jgi:thioredoxin 1
MIGIALFTALITGPLSATELTNDFESVPVNGVVTMIDLGAKSCIPCKMMEPVMKKVEERFRGKAAIIFIDVWKHRDQVQRFGLRAIPTQIFFDKEGKEFYRHVGFMSENDIAAKLKEMGVEP